MENKACVSIELICRDIELNRTSALKKCVLNVKSLKDEFYKSVDFSVFDPDFADKLNIRMFDFIKEKGLHIIDENPVVVIEDGRYEIVVNYIIGW